VHVALDDVRPLDFKNVPLLGSSNAHCSSDCVFMRIHAHEGAAESPAWSGGSNTDSGYGVESNNKVGSRATGLSFAAPRAPALLLFDVA
jgi:hypothetical protein